MIQDPLILRIYTNNRFVAKAYHFSRLIVLPHGCVGDKELQKQNVLHISFKLRLFWTEHGGSQPRPLTFELSGH